MIAQYTVLRSFHPGNQNWLEWVGALVVLIAAILSPVWEVLRQAPEPQDVNSDTKEDDKPGTRKKTSDNV